MPLLFMWGPGIAHFVDLPWIFAAMYYYPVTWLLGPFGSVGLVYLHPLLSLLYSGLIALLCDHLLIGGWRYDRRISGLAARSVFVLPAVVAAVVLTARIVGSMGILPKTIECPPDSFREFREPCGQVEDLQVHELGVFLDRTYILRYRSGPKRLADIRRQYERVVEPPRGPWQKGPLWWRRSIRRQGAEVYRRPGFSLTGRGPDGDHYLYVVDPQSREVFVYIKANF